MSNITVCRVLNKSNETEQEEFTVYAEWSDYDLNIVILRKNKLSMQGKAVLTTFEKFAKTFDKSLDTYLREMQDILSGKESDVEFHLQDEKFFWKKKHWALGKMIMEPVTDFQSFTRITLEIANHYSVLRRNVDELQEESVKFKNLNFELKKQLDNLIVKKNEMEETLYKKFILLLNTKKAKIKELKSRLQSLEHDRESIYDAPTDESDCETISKNPSNRQSSPNESNKKRSNDDDDEVYNVQKRKNQETISNRSTSNQIDSQNGIIKIQSDISAIPSTSKSMDKINLEEDEETPDILSDESECEVQLQLDDDKIEIPNPNKKKISAIINDNSDEEMF